jgi:hypothetical protein
MLTKFGDDDEYRLVGLLASFVRIGRDRPSGRIPMSELSWARRELDDAKFGATPKKPSDMLAAGDLILVEPVTQTADRKVKYPAATYGLRHSLANTKRRLVAESGMTALERAGPGTCRSFRINRSAGFDRGRVKTGGF